ncbi:MAG: hypothetical protein ACI4TE_05115 [Alphaproteobacteria bacterium]
MSTELKLSTLGHTWIFDVDGTICVHNGYKNGGDRLLDGVRELFAQIPDQDMIVFITSRKSEEKERLEQFLKENTLRFDHIIFNAPFGERILINDDKPDGLKCALALNKGRDQNFDLNLVLTSEK